MIQLQENNQTDRKKDGRQKDRQALHYRTFRDTAGGPINTKKYHIGLPKMRLNLACKTKKLVALT